MNVTNLHAALATVVALLSCTAISTTVGAQIMPQAEREQRYRDNCIARNAESTAACRQLLKEIDNDPDKAKYRPQAEQMFEQTCSPDKIRSTPALADLCAQMKSALQQPTATTSSSSSSSSPARRDPRDYCDCNQIRGSCVARVVQAGKSLTVTSSTNTCSWVIYRINGEPQSLTFRGGSQVEQWVGQRDIRNLEIEACRVCFDPQVHGR